MLASFFPMVTMVNENADYWRWFCHCQNCEDCQKLGFRYLTVTMCGNACPCPDSVVVTLFWIGKKLKAIFLKTFFWIYFPGYFNSTLNPVIYAMTNRDFKLAFIGILKKLFCCASSGRTNNSDF